MFIPGKRNKLSNRETAIFREDYLVNFLDSDQQLPAAAAADCLATGCVKNNLSTRQQILVLRFGFSTSKCNTLKCYFK